MKKIAYDCIALDQGQIVEDSKCCLKVNAIIARAGVYQYEDGKALKSKLELLKATRTARYAKLTVGNHPPTQVIMNQNDIYGGVEKPFFDNGKLRAVLSFDKYTVPDETIDKIREAVNTKTGIDNSIGFYYDADWTPGIDRNVNTDAEEHYDYIMRNIVIDHVAVITDNQGGRLHGRCSFPKCGIGADCLTCPRKVGKTFSSLIEGFKKDVVEKHGNKWCVMHCHGPEAGTPIQCFDTEEEAQAKHRAIEAQKHGANGIDLYGLPQNVFVNNTFADDLPSSQVPNIKGGIEKVAELEPGETTDQLYAACIKEKMRMGMTRGEAETYCLAPTSGQDNPTPTNQPTKQPDLGKTGGGAKKGDVPSDGGEGSQSTVEKTPLEKCIAIQVEAGKSPAEAESWCRADLAGEHESVDALLERADKLLEQKRQHDINAKRPHIS